MRDPGNTLSTAYNYGNASGTINHNYSSQFVGSSDLNDYYRFTLSNSSSFNVTLSGLSADADLQLLDSNGGFIASSTNGGTQNDSISRTLGPGTYYARVYPFSTANTSYRLDLSGSGAGIDPGNTFGSAFDYGEFGVNNSRNWNDFVGSSDTNDYYRFSVSESANFRVSISGLSADADLELYNASGNLIGSSRNAGTATDAIASNLSVGTYYARVLPYGSANTNYDLSVAYSG